MGQFSHGTVTLTLELGRMTEEVHKYHDMMGETGAGIMREEDIDMECNNSLTQSWGMSLCLKFVHAGFDDINLQPQSRKNAHGSSS